MRILIISQYYYPEQFLINEIAPELVKRGNEVTVLTGRPNYPVGKVFKGYEGNKRANEMISGVRVIRLPIVPRGSRKIKLLINYFSYMLLASRASKSLDGQFDVVFLYQLTPILQAYPAIKFARRNRIPLICYCLDLAPLSGNEVAPYIKPMHFIYRRFSRWAYKNCDKIAVTSKDFIDYLISVHGIPEERLSYIPQHAPELFLKTDMTKKEFDEVLDLMFAGNIGYGAHLDKVLYAIEPLFKQGLRFRVNIVGDGSAKPMLQDLSRRLLLDSCVIFWGRVPMSEMDKIYSKADAFIVTLRKSQITLPGKVQAYMATGKPILGAMDGSGKSLIEEVGCGLCVNADDVSGFTKILKDFILYPSKYASCGKRGQEYCKANFQFHSFMDKLSVLLGAK